MQFISPCLTYLETYVPQSDWEEKIIPILQNYGAIAAEIAQVKQELAAIPEQQEKKSLERRLGKLEKLELRKIAVEIKGLVFEKLSLSSPRQYLDQQVYLQNKQRCDDEYESLKNDVIAQFFKKILTEFEPEKGIIGKTLTDKLSIWVNSKLRLKWDLIDIIYPDRPNSSLKLWLVLEFIVEANPEGFTHNDWLGAVNDYRQENNARFSDQTVAKFFANTLPKVQAKEPDGDRLFVDLSKVQTKIVELMPLQVESIDREMGDEEDGRRSLIDIIKDFNKPEPDDALTVSRRIELIFTRFSQYLKSLQHSKTSQCNCGDVVHLYLHKKCQGKSTNEKAFAAELGIENATYQSFKERTCLTEFWQLFIQNSPAAKLYGESQTIYFKEYLEERLNFALNRHPKTIYYVGERKSMAGEKLPSCNAQFIAQHRLSCLGYPEESWGAIAEQVGFKSTQSTTVRQFWAVKCLPHLVARLFNVEDKYINQVDLANYYWEGL